jgi:NADPH-dependent ferric siderophore reductase
MGPVRVRDRVMAIVPEYDRLMSSSPPDPGPGGNAPRKPPTARRVEVLHVHRLSPRMVRVTFTGEALDGFEWRGPAGHLKLTVPEEGSHDVPMPAPDGPRSPFMRTYTPRRFDASLRELDVDLVLHDEGPAGKWAVRAQKGDRLVVMGPAPGYRIDADAPSLVLAGDETALPAIETILEELPAHTRARVYVEVANHREARPLQSAASIEVRWLSRGEDFRDAGKPLEEALRAQGALPGGAPRIYVGCEAAAMRRIRDYLLKERGVERSMLVTRGYWKLGAVNPSDKDYGEEG